MEFVLTHLGHIVQFKVLCTQKNSRKLITTLTVCVFEYHSYDNTFKKLTENDSTLQVEFPGKFQLLQCAKVDCEKTGVVQPCVLLVQQSKSSSYEQLLLYQLTDLKKLNHILYVDLIDSKVPDNFSAKLKFYICHGPVVVTIDSWHKKVHCYKIVEDNVVELNASIEMTNGTVFDFASGVDSDTVHCEFVSQCSHSTSRTNQKLKWTHVLLTLNFNQMLIDIKFNDLTILPNVYCCSTNTVVSVSPRAHSYLLTTSRSQLIMIKDGKVECICDIPFESCDRIFEVGKGKNKVAALLDSSRKAFCVVSLETQEVVKQWDKVFCITSGIFGISGYVKECILLLLSNLEQNCIEAEEYLLIADIEDVMKPTKKKVEDFSLNLPSVPMDTECDLFSSPGNADDKIEASNTLTKVVKALEATVSKQKSDVEQLRLDLKHCDSVVSASKQAICSMNNNVLLHHSTEKNNMGFGDMVDFFTGEPSSSGDHQLPNDLPETMLKLRKSWTRIICDSWILGFDFVNLSEKWFSDFAVVLSPSSPRSVANCNFITCSNITKKVQVSENDETKKNIPDIPMQNNNINTGIHVVEPHEEFTITSKICLQSFENFQETLFLSIGLVATVKDDLDTLNDKFIFNLGKLSFGATDLATNTFSLDLDNLSNAKCETSRDDLKALKAYHTHAKLVEIRSDKTEVLAACKDLLKYVGFVNVELLGAYLCAKAGPFYLSTASLEDKSKTSVNVRLSCKSEFAASLLLRYFREQMPYDFTIVEMQ